MYDIHTQFLRTPSSLQIIILILGGLKLHSVQYLMSRINKNVLVCDSDDQNAKYVIASKGTQAVYLNLNFQVCVYS
jgi:hypothetical protein